MSWIKKYVILFIFLNAYHIFSQNISEQIIIDQFGWPVNSKKIVIMADPQQGQNSAVTFVPGAGFTVRRASDNITVFTGTLTPWKGGQKHSQSGDIVWWGDFSSLTTPGEYYIYEAKNNARSYNFFIKDDVYKGVLDTAVKAFYFQRCGTQVSSGVWSHNACHLADRNAQLYTNGKPRGNARDVSGGWHDAGDYNKYVPFLSDTLWNLLKAYELSPQKFSDNIGIPESGNGIPDILDEIKYELDWMLKMQLTNSYWGSLRYSVANRVAGLNCSGNCDPAYDGAQRYYTHPTTWATATFAAICAYAARIYQTFNPTYANILLQAATNAWKFLETRPTRYPSDGSDKAPQLGCGGALAGCSSSADLRLRIFAAAELFRTTGQAKYHIYFTNNYTNSASRDGGFHPLKNNNFMPCTAEDLNKAFFTYAQTPGARADIVNWIKSALANGVNWHIEGPYNNGDDAYRAYMWDGHYCWGSTQMKAGWIKLLIYAIELGINPAKNNLYKEIALEYLHWYHGRNPLSWVYLSNMTNSTVKHLGADKSITEMFHTWFNDGCQFDRNPAPGFVPGGPNQYFSVDIYPPKGEPPQKAYKNWNTGWPENSWEITEPAIYYQAAYVLVLSYFMPSSSIKIKNFTVTPDTITNHRNVLVQFLANLTTATGNITSVTLNLVSLGLGKKPMTNISGNTQWRYSCFINSGFSPGNYYIDAVGYNNLGSVAISTVLLKIEPYMKVIYFKILPNTITNNKINLVNFLANISSATGNITSVTLNLSSLGLGKKTMTNISGGTQWRYSCSIPINFPVGKYDIYIISYNNLGVSTKVTNFIYVNLPVLTGMVEVRGNYVRFPLGENFSEIYVEILEGNTPLKIVVYDVLGQVVNEIVDGIYNIGAYRFYWNIDEKVKPGLYFIMTKINSNPIFKKVVIVK